MKKIVLAALATSAALATPAAAQSVTTGTINITGTVAPKCFVVPGAGSTFGTTVAMGELAASNGMLKPSATLASTFANVGGAALTAQVLCTSAAPSVSVTAEPLATTAEAATGYDNSIDYTAVVTFQTVTAPQVVEDTTTAAAATSDVLTGRLNASGPNISVATKDWTASGVLVASDAYSGKITISVSPAA